MKNWYTGVSEATRNIIRTNTIKKFYIPITNEIDRIMMYIGNEFFRYD